MLARIALGNIIPKINVSSHRAVNTSDIADQPSIQEHPHIIVAEEIVFQRAYVILSQLEVDAVLHAEEVVVRQAVIAGRIQLSAVISLILSAILIISSKTVFPWPAIHRPEIVGPDVVVDRCTCNRIIKIFKSTQIWTVD